MTCIALTLRVCILLICEGSVKFTRQGNFYKLLKTNGFFAAEPQMPGNFYRVKFDAAVCFQQFTVWPPNCSFPVAEKIRPLYVWNRYITPRRISYSAAGNVPHERLECVRWADWVNQIVPSPYVVTLQPRHGIHSPRRRRTLCMLFILWFRF